MARAIARHYWDDGTRTHFEVAAPDSMPDGIDEARVQVMRMWRAALEDDVAEDATHVLGETADEATEGEH